MRPLLFHSLLLLVGLETYAFNPVQSPVSRAFIQSSVVPDLLSFPPDKYARIMYDMRDLEMEAALGNELTPQQTKHQPLVFWESMPGQLYTLLMTDLDSGRNASATSEHEHPNEWHHWVVLNVPCNRAELGDHLAHYIGPEPAKGSGLHRYVFLVYHQPYGRIVDAQLADINTCPEKRAGWRTTDFAWHHRLGNPIAGNFFVAEHDDAEMATPQSTGENTPGPPTH